MDVARAGNVCYDVANARVSFRWLVGNVRVRPSGRALSHTRKSAASFSGSLGENGRVPRYDVACGRCGPSEVFAHSRDVPGALRCGHCGERAPQVFSPESLPQTRMVVGGEDVTTAARVAEGTSHINIGLPPVETIVGRRSDGKPRLATRPVTHNELGSARGTREYAKRHGLIPQGDTYRAVGPR